MEPQSAPSQERRRSPRSVRALQAIAALAIVLAAGTWLYLAVREGREAVIACRSQCHLNQLQLALCNYHDMYGCFPPAYLTDAKGTPVHSWRVLILPFIEERSLYEAYRFDEPWNGPNNRKLADRMPEIFHMPSEPASTALTNIVAIVGPGTAFPGSGCTRIDEFADGPDNTILLAEITASDIPWLEPRDLRVGQMSFTVNDRRKPAISSSRRRGPYVVFADSIHTYQLSPSLRPEALEALTTIAGGEKMYVAEIDGVGLTSPAEGPATDEKIRQLSLDRLCSLWLSRSDVTDDSLTHLAAAPSLSTLHLRSTRVTDDGLRRFQRGPPLSCLDLSHTAIGDDGLRRLAGLTPRDDPRIDIWLEGSRVTMPGVVQFLKCLPEPKFPAQTWLNVNEGSVSQEIMFFGASTVTDAQIECFQGLTGFRSVDLSKTQITDASLKVVGGFTRLENLYVSSTRITDSGLSNVKGLTRLQWLTLNDTAVTDSALEHLKGLSRLRWLDLRGTRVTERGVKRLEQALPDCGVTWEPPTKDEPRSGAAPGQPGG